VTCVFVLSDAREYSAPALKEWRANSQASGVRQQPTVCQARHAHLGSVFIHLFLALCCSNVVHEASSVQRRLGKAPKVPRQQRTVSALTLSIAF
jgi:hypothetical protein